MKKTLYIVTLLFALLVGASATTVSGTLLDNGGKPVKNGMLVFELKGCSNVYKVIPDGKPVEYTKKLRTLTGAVSGSVLGNDQLACGSAAGPKTTYYHVTSFIGSEKGPESDYLVNGSTFDYNSAVSLQGIPAGVPPANVVLQNPIGDQTIEQPAGTTFRINGNFVAALDWSNVFNKPSTYPVAWPMLASDGSATSPSYAFANSTGTGFYRLGSSIGWSSGGYGVGTLGNGYIYLGSSVPYVQFYDSALLRDAANTLALRNGLNAQFFRIYNIYTDAGNYERASLGWSSNLFTISAEGTGTGLQRNLRLQANAIDLFGNGGKGWTISSSGYLLAAADNAYDIGSLGAYRPRNLYVANIIRGSGTQEWGGGYSMVRGGFISWSTSTTDPSWGGDLSISRLGAGVMGIGNGTNGDSSATVQAGNFQALNFAAQGNTNPYYKLYDGTNTSWIQLTNGVLDIYYTGLPIRLSGSVVQVGSSDTGLSRVAARQINVGNGTAGDYSGTLVATQFCLTPTNCITAWPSGSSGSMVYPPAGVPISTGSAWGTSYTVGTAASNLVQLNASAQLPAVSGVNLTGLNASNLGSGTVPAARMPALSGDITSTAGSTATTLKNTGTAGTYTKVTTDAQGRVSSGTQASAADLSDGANLKTRMITLLVGADSATSALADTDDQASFFVNRLGYSVTIQEIYCESDAGTPIIQIQKDDGSPTNMLSANLTCSTSGASATSFVSGENVVANANRLDFQMVTAGGTAKRITLVIKYTL